MGKIDRLRGDIQALRGFAVLVVILFHAGINAVPSGFLGVDVFFVISGFLITGLICREISESRFSFLRFFSRRARRLLPAAYSTFFFTVLAAPFFLLPKELVELKNQLFGALTFSANVVLWMQSGYFDGASELKPLLHTWSLAIEEQYYIFLPLLLFFTPKRYWLHLCVFLTLSSAVLCVLFQSKPSAVFYLLPTRAWELCVGSIGALVVPSLGLKKLIEKIFPLAIVCLLALPFFDKFGTHPGLASFLICFSTLFVILRRYDSAADSIMLLPLRRLGDISYSLYLVHWPVFAFYNNTWMGGAGAEKPLADRFLLLFLSMVLAILMHKLIENPGRENVFFQRNLFKKVAFSSLVLILCVSSYLGWFVRGSYGEDDRAPNAGLGVSCDFIGGSLNRAECKTADHPKFVVWGDSYAMHLVRGIADIAGDSGVLQATKSMCGPFLNISTYKPGGGYDLEWATECMRFNNLVFNHILSSDSIQHVVLSSYLSQYLEAGFDLAVRMSDGIRVVDVDKGLVLESLFRVVSELEQKGKKVVFVAPPPAGGFDPARCNERLKVGLPITGAIDCEIRVSDYSVHRENVREFIDQAALVRRGSIVGFDDYLCSAEVCLTQHDGHSFYSDSGHLSKYGSLFLISSLDVLGLNKILLTSK